LQSAKRLELDVGRLGRIVLARGWYLYVGSAFGPGGVAARCKHHRRISERPRWHIDYLRAASRLREIWFTHDSRRREHQWAGILRSHMGLEIPSSGFGASDCDCESHMFYVVEKPDFQSFQACVHADLAGHGVIHCEFV
jgi:Uri superfamily endonuclease